LFGGKGPVSIPNGEAAFSGVTTLRVSTASGFAWPAPAFFRFGVCSSLLELILRGRPL